MIRHVKMNESMMEYLYNVNHAKQKSSIFNSKERQEGSEEAKSKFVHVRLLCIVFCLSLSTVNCWLLASYHRLLSIEVNWNVDSKLLNRWTVDCGLSTTNLYIIIENQPLILQ